MLKIGKNYEKKLRHPSLGCLMCGVCAKLSVKCVTPCVEPAGTLVWIFTDDVCRAVIQTVLVNHRMIEWLGLEDT